MKLKTKKFIVIFLAALFVLTPVLKAEAFLGVGDAVIVVGDPYQDIIDGIKSAVGQAFAQFTATFLTNLMQKIESNYKVANFLYYSDALVSGQYLQNYMDKYVPNPNDQRMILTFIPQFSCGKKVDISQQLKQQADNYLGFDPHNLSTSDPAFYFKLAKMGDFLSSPQGWNIYYKDLANAAESQASGAAQNELNSPGIKAPHDNAGSIATSINSIVDEEQASLIASLDLGTNNPDSIVGQMAEKLTYTFLNSFVFKGAVFKEQATCLDPTQLSPIAAANGPTLGTAAAASIPTQNSLLQASPASVAAGGTVFLTWDARSVPGAASAILSPNIGKVSLNGSTQVKVFASTNYSLAVRDANNNVLKVFNVTVTVF